MEYLIIGTVLGLCLFIIPMWSYRRGLKDGLAINQGKTPEPIKTPVAAVKNHYTAKKSKEEEDKVTQGLQNILSYDGSPQEVKHEE